MCQHSDMTELVSLVTGRKKSRQARHTDTRPLHTATKRFYTGITAARYFRSPSLFPTNVIKIRWLQTFAYFSLKKYTIIISSYDLLYMYRPNLQTLKTWVNYILEDTFVLLLRRLFSFLALIIRMVIIIIKFNESCYIICNQATTTRRPHMQMALHI